MGNLIYSSDPFPDIIENRKIYYKLGYLTVNFTFVALILLSEQVDFVKSFTSFPFLWISEFTSIVSFFLVQGSDPGYLNSYNTYDFGVRTVESKFDNLEYKESKDTIIDSHESSFEESLNENELQNFLNCPKCDLTVPIRSHHCRDCDRCVATFDHHCHVIGTCIGEKNHCRFWWCLFLHFILLWISMDIVSVSSTLFLSAKDIEDSSTIKNITYFALGIFLFYITLLLGFQTWIVLSSMTTYEGIKGPQRLSYLRGTDEFDLPFSRTLLHNIIGFCCRRDLFSCYWWHCRCTWQWRNCSVQHVEWKPERWSRPAHVNRDSDDIWNNPWQNKYYSCC